MIVYDDDEDDEGDSEFDTSSMPFTQPARTKKSKILLVR
jgi:hypothetical protein